MRLPHLSWLLLAWLVSLAAPAVAQFEPTSTVSVMFQTTPSGAKVIQRGLSSFELGRSGEVVHVSFPQQREITLHFRFQLAGYRDFDLDVETRDLRKAGSETVYIPQDRPIPLTPTSLLSALWHALVAHWLLVVVGATGLAAAVVLWLLPYRRRMRQRVQRLHAVLDTTESQQDAMVGQLRGKWLLTQALGRGGCALVYRALPFDSLDEKDAVAVKIMLDRNWGEEARARFIREVNICKSLNHPNLVRLLDWEQGAEFYLVMELVEGQSLRRCIRRYGMDVAEVMQLMEGVFEALSYAHQRGIVHCDMKPENVMVTYDGRVRVMDFGIATGRSFQRLTATATVLGTPGYLAPEQLDGVRNDARSDQYAVGVMLFEMLTGRAPFEAEDPVLRMTLHLTQPAPLASDVNAQVSAAVSAVVDRMLAKEPHDRYASMTDAWGALVEAGSG